MLKAFKAIRASERGNTAAAFVTLFGLIGSHSILETARDALFLSSIPATRLPWVYLAIAAVSLIITQLQAFVSGRIRGRVALAASVGAAALVTFAFWATLDALGAFGLYALYIWSGVLTALVVVGFWTLLAGIFTVTQAKRLYGLVGAGSVAGAIAGSATASALAQIAPARTLLLASACTLAATALAPLAFRDVSNVHGDAAPLRPSILESGRYVAGNPYARRVALLVVVGAAAVTLADYIFKSRVSSIVPQHELAATFATVYLVLNVISLFVQIGLVGWVLRRFGVMTALSLLPLLLFGGGLGMLAIGGLGAALAIKGADGALRYSMHRTALELLFVPLSERARRRAKAFIDVLGQRGGQALVSVGILISVAVGLSVDAWAVALIALASLWLFEVWRLRRHYLDLFRRHLRRDQVRHIDEFPELDVASLETVIAALDSAEDSQVVAALDVLELERKSHLVPALILHHPGEEVVERALELFARDGRHSVVPVIDRHLEHPSPRVRGAMLAARSVLAPDEAMLRQRLSLEDSAEVRSTIMVNLIASGAIVGSDASEALAAICQHGSAEARHALAEAIGRRRAEGFEDALIELAHAREAEVRLATTRAMGEIRAPRFLPALIRLLGDERTRREARAVLRRFGEQGFEALVAALHSRELDPVLRWHVPRAIAGFEASRAARALLERLPIEWEGMARYRIIRALESLVRRHPRLVLDRDILDSVIHDTISRAYRYLDRRLVLERGAAEDEHRRTPGHAVLVDMLRDKEQHAVDRLFRLFDLAHPRESFVSILRGLSSPDPTLRASSMELADNLVEPRWREAVRGLVDDVADSERLEEGREFHEPTELDYEEALATMLESSSLAVQDLTAYHVAELGLVSLRHRVASMPRDALSRPDVARCLQILDELAAESERGASYAE